jgi:hypothetical protein
MIAYYSQLGQAEKDLTTENTEITEKTLKKLRALCVQSVCGKDFLVFCTRI